MSGVGFMSQRVERRIVTASQIQSLPQFEAYIAFAYDSPTAFARFKPFPFEKIAEPFVSYVGRGFAEHELSVMGMRDEGDDRDPTEVAAEQVAEAPSYEEEFDRYRKGLLKSGLVMFEDDDDLGALHSHFQMQRGKKIPLSDIGPPPLSGHMMQGTHEPPMKRNHTWTTKKSIGAELVAHDADGVVVEVEAAPAVKVNRKRPKRKSEQIIAGTTAHKPPSTHSKRAAGLIRRSDLLRTRKDA